MSPALENAATEVLPPAFLRPPRESFVMSTYEHRWETTLVNAVAAAIGQTCRDNRLPKDQLLHIVNALVEVIAKTALMYPSMRKPAEQQVCVDLVAARLKVALAKGRWIQLASKVASNEPQQRRPRPMSSAA